MRDVPPPKPTVSISSPQVKVEQVVETKTEPKKVDEKALNEAMAEREVLKKQLKDAKDELAETRADAKNSGQCTVDGVQMTIAALKSKISTEQLKSKKEVVAKINADITDKKNAISLLEQKISEKESTVKKMIAGTVATSTVAVAGAGGLAVAIADLVKTKMSAKKLQNGEAVCGKYGLLVK